MKRGFTLLEILIVIIIIAVLATLAMNQYMNTIERSRGAEVRQVFGHLRSLCAAFYMEDGTTARCNSANLSIGTGNQDIPVTGSCKETHFFAYEASSTSDDVARFKATRCTTGSSGKSPWKAANEMILDVDYGQGGNDTWVPGAFAY